ncbi:hypothetical protein GCM10011505_20830 [Tistrella bauzanensis]|uniref:Flagella-associated GTP-binding protein n=1 Tax=Tistrella bauzanensis TaxID=657419 RepID=A0ABQ1IGA3_9PROT|nr:hypothetical protein [Tistrella bauzanensis]GGB39097.1 hypothetical protein GCM10011505_20830 [Tistrella bauzanensis]
MRLKTFQAADMAQALAEVRRVLGDDAIIVSTVPAESGRGVVVTAAIDGPPRPQPAAAAGGRASENTDDPRRRPAPRGGSVAASAQTVLEERAALHRRSGGARPAGATAGTVPPAVAERAARMPLLRSPADDDEIELEFEQEEAAALAPAAASSAARQAARGNREDGEAEDRPRLSPDLALVERALAFHGIAGQTGRRLLVAARDRLRCQEPPERALAQALDRVVGFDPLGRGGHRPQAFALVGPTGAGKTVTVAKLAARAITQGRRLTVVTADTIRAGGIEQLAAYTGMLGIDLLVAGSSRELARVAARARSDAAGEPMTLLVDTAGVNPFFAEETEELAALIDAAELEPILVLPAGLDPFEAADQGAAFASLHPRRAICTRLDGARRLGAVIAAAAAAHVRLSEASVTAHVSEGLNPLSAAGLAQLLLRDPLNLRPAKLDRDAEIRP